MRRWWILAGVIIGAGLGQPAAATSAWLYRPSEGSAAPAYRILGTPIPVLPEYRLLHAASDLSLLSVDERLTVQRNVQYRALFTPNDPQYPLQWNLTAMHVPSAWDADQIAPVNGGDPSVVVAVLDTGLASSAVGSALHVPDINLDTVWTNNGETAGDQIDNDHNGRVDDVHGWNFIGNNALSVDDNGHGTHISGVVAAATNNELATAGIAWQVKIMPLKVLDAAGNGTTASLTAALQYAVAQGADIVNLSLGGDQDDPIFHQAIIDAVAQGVVVIGAAGNDGLSTVTYPARYDEVLSVGATEGTTARASYSNYGSALDLVAPGNDVVDQNSDGQKDGILAQTCSSTACTAYATMYFVGTSQAAAQASAVAALLASCGATAGNIRGLLTSTAQDLGTAGRDDVFGAGLVDAGAALQASGCSASAPEPPSVITAVAGPAASSPVINGRPYPYVRPVFTWTGPAGAAYDLSLVRGGTTLITARQTATSFSTKLTTEGVYTFVVRSVDGAGRTSTPVSFIYRYRKPVPVVATDTAIHLLSADFKSLRVVRPIIPGPAYGVTGGVIRSDFASSLLVTSQPSGPTVTVIDSRGRRLRTVQPFGSSFRGSIQTAMLRAADGRGVFVAGTNSQGASLAWFTADGKLLGRNLVFGKYAKGVELASGDLDGDGVDELIVSQVAGSEIRVYNSQRQRLAILRPRGPTFTQGWMITAGDTDGDGRAEIIATPHVAASSPKVIFLTLQGKEIRNWKLKNPAPTVGLRLQALDLNGDGLVEILSVPQRGTIVLQRWSFLGKLNKQLTIGSRTTNALSRL